VSCRKRKGRIFQHTGGIELIVCSTALTVIKKSSERLQSGQTILQRRKEQDGKILGILRKKGEIVGKHITEEKQRVKERAETRDLEFAASVYSVIADKMSGSKQFRLCTCGSCGDGTSTPAHINVSGANSLVEEAPSASSRGRYTCRASAKYAGGKRGLTVSYSAKDGSLFEVEVGAQGKNLQVCVLPQEERIGRLLRVHRADISEALAVRGFHIRRFEIARGGRFQA